MHCKIKISKFFISLDFLYNCEFSRSEIQLPENQIIRDGPISLLFVLDYEYMLTYGYSISRSNNLKKQ